MTAPQVAYVVLGAALCVALAGLAVHYYSKSRRARVEQPKYKMLEDDE